MSQSFGYTNSSYDQSSVVFHSDADPDYEALPASCTLQDHMVAGACAGVLEHVVMYPVDCVKTRMQCLRPTHYRANYPNVIEGVVCLLRTEGLRGSLRGIGAMIGGAGPAHAAYFGCYEKVKAWLEESHLQSTHLSAIVGGSCATLLHDVVMTPADAIKQRLQIFNSPYHNTIDCLRRVCLTEGPGVLYRAYFTQLTMNIPYQSLHFVCYEAMQDLLNPSRHYLPWTHVVAGGTAGCLAAAFTNPLDVCKTILNTQDGHNLPSGVKPEQTGLLYTARLVFKLHGIRGFFRGVSARVLTAVPGTAISWSVYEYFKWYLRKGSTSGPGSSPNNLNEQDIGSNSSKIRSRLFNATTNEVVCASPKIGPCLSSCADVTVHHHHQQHMLDD